MFRSPFAQLFCFGVVLILRSNVNAVVVTAPTAGEDVDLAKAFVIKWTVESGDPDNLSIDLLNATDQNPLPTLENIAHNLNSSALQVNVTWPFSVPNDTAEYQLYFIASASGNDVANSPLFNLTLPPGENRTQAEGTVGPYGTHPSSDYAPKSPSSHELNGGDIAGIVIGILAVIAIGIAASFYMWRRRQIRRKKDDRRLSEKPELDGTDKPAPKRGKAGGILLGNEVDGESDMKEMDGEEDRKEVEGDSKNYLRYELPTTPPPEPVELAGNEIAAAEMHSPEMDTGEVFDSMPPTRKAISNLAPERPDSARSARDRAMSIQSGSTTIGGRDISFAEALHDIVSHELRRKE